MSPVALIPTLGKVALVEAGFPVSVVNGAPDGTAKRSFWRQVLMSKYDRCDPDHGITKLTRAGHHLWHLRRKKGVTADEEQAIDAALETIWQAKRERKSEVAVAQSNRAARTRQYFVNRRKVKALLNCPQTPSRERSQVTANQCAGIEKQRAQNGVFL